MNKGRICQPLNRQRAHPDGVENFAFDQDPRNAYAIKNILGKPHAILLVEHKINFLALVGNEYQRTSCRTAQLRAEGMIICVSVSAQVAICISDLTANAHSLPGLNLSDKQINVSLLGQTPRPCQGWKLGPALDRMASCSAHYDLRIGKHTIPKSRLC